MNYKKMNYKKTIPAASILIISLLSSPTYAGDFNQGKTLHNTNCIECHTRLMNGKPDDIYTRKDRRVNDFEGLFRQVNRCKSNLNLDWSETKIDGVITYLNQQYYKFDF